MMRHVLLCLSVVALATGLATVAFGEERAGTVTIPYKEYEELKKAAEADEDEQYWNMTFQQILEKEKGSVEKAWGLYEYYVLRTVYLDREVDAGSAGDLIADLNILNEIDAEKPITMVISSPGGSLFDGLNLYNAMMASAAPVHTVCDGWAMSMAAVLLAAGHHRVARDGCIFMMHEVAGGGGGGQTSDKIKGADWFLSIENVLLQILSENSGLSVRDVTRLGEFETFWNAEEALALGFVDEVSGQKPRALTAGSRALPAELLPKTRIARQITERMAE